MIERTDAEHLQLATERNRVLYSFNRGDFLRLHSLYLAEGRTHAGILLARQQHYSLGEQMRRVLKVMALKSSAEMCNSVEFLSASGMNSGACCPPVSLSTCLPVYLSTG